MEALATDVLTSCRSSEAPSLLAINGGAGKERAEATTLVGASAGPVAFSASSRTIFANKALGEN